MGIRTKLPGKLFKTLYSKWNAKMKHDVLNTKPVKGINLEFVEVIAEAETDYVKILAEGLT